MEIGLDVLHAQEGDKRMITVADDDPEARKQLAKEIMRIVRRGYYVAIGGTERQAGKKISGYDPVTNEWLVKKGKIVERFSAKKFKRATAIAPQSGG